MPWPVEQRVAARIVLLKDGTLSGHIGKTKGWKVGCSLRRIVHLRIVQPRLLLTECENRVISDFFQI